MYNIRITGYQSIQPTKPGMIHVLPAEMVFQNLGSAQDSGKAAESADFVNFLFIGQLRAHEQPRFVSELAQGMMQRQRTRLGAATTVGGVHEDDFEGAPARGIIRAAKHWLMRMSFQHHVNGLVRDKR